MTALPVRLDRLTPYRFFAGMSVLVFHASIVRGRPGWAEPFLRSGPSAVTYFFVLSGFVLTWTTRTARRDFTTPRFFALRGARILPAHLVALALAFAVQIRYSSSPPLGVVVAQATLVQTWWPVQRLIEQGSVVTWSLSCELGFYLAFPFVLRVLPATRRARVIALAALVAAAWLLRFVCAGIGGDDLLYAIVVFPPARFPEFVAGMVLADLVLGAHHGKEAWLARLAAVPWPAVVALCMLGMAWTGEVGKPWINGIFGLLPSVLVIAWAAGRDIERRPSVLHNRVVQWLGATSFCLYLVHLSILRVLDHFLITKGWAPGFLELWPRVAVSLVLSILGGGLLHHLVERPAEASLRARILGRTRVPATAGGG